MKTTITTSSTKNPFRACSFSSVALVTLTAFAIAGTAQTSANNYTWTGGVNGDWNDAGNWDIGIPGAYNHNLIFSGTSNTATNNDIGGSFGSITFSNTTAGQDFSLSGNGINLYGTVSTAAVVGGGTIEDTISINLRTTAGPRLFDLGTNHNLLVNGVIFGPQSIVKSGDGTLTLSAANSYAGSTTINGGTLVFAGSGTIAEANAIVINDTGTLRFSRNDTWGNAGTDTSSSITINAGGTMESGGFYNTIRDLNLNGGTVAMTGGVNATYPALALKGTVTIGGSQASQINTISGTNNMISIGDASLGATVFNVADATGDASADLSVNAVLQNNSPQGGNSLTKTGSGTMELTATNTYTGTTSVNEGTLRMVNSTTGNAIRGNGHNYVIASGATLEANRTGGSQVGISNFNISGSGTFKTSGLEMEQTSSGSTVNMSSGALFHVESGRYNFGQAGTGTWTNNLSDMQVDNGATFNGAATSIVVDALDGAGTVLTGGGITVGVDNGSGSFSGIIGNSNFGSAYSITKAGSGTQTLSGANTYTGTTTVSEGTLSLASGYTHSGSGAYTVQGGTLKIADGVDISGHAMTISLGGVISPGNSPGTASTGSQTWNDGGAYLWEVNDSGGTKGDDPGWDWLDITGTLELGSLSAGGFTIDIDSLTASNVVGDAVGFDTFTQMDGIFDYSFVIATASGGINDFDASLFTLDSSGFSNAPSWDWQIVLSGNDLVLEAYAVPEPSSTALLGLGGLALALRRKRS
ncbi:MAG: beta strand repeat-containing protein [Akkermansiaceae bacterium]